MYPATKVIPKALFPLVDPQDNLVKPILYMLCDMTLKALEAQQDLTEEDISKFKLIIVIQEDQRPFLEHFFYDHSLDHLYAKDKVMKQQIDRIKQIAQYIELVVQEEQAGLGHAILICEPHVHGENSFMLMLGDHVYIAPKTASGSCVQQMIQAYQRTDGALSITSVSTTVESELSVNGVLKMDDSSLDSSAGLFKVETTYEKPSSQTAEELGLFLDHSVLSKIGGFNEQQQTNERQCLCYFGMDILTIAAFDYLRENWIILQEENKTRTKKEELNLRMHGMKQLIESKEHGMLGVFINGNRCDTGLPVPYLNSMNAVYRNS